MDKIEEEVRSWWRTSIIDMEPGKIAIRGTAIENLLGHVSFVQMIWLMLRGSLPSKEEATLLESALVAGVDHGPQAPSIAASRMAITCGVGLNNAMATALNMLGDVHGGAGEQCAELFYRCSSIAEKPHEKVIKEVLQQWRQEKGKIIPGYGHRFHKNGDPRAPRLIELAQEAADKQIIKGHFISIAKMIGNELQKNSAGRLIPLNIDGASAIIFCELGFASPLSRGLFCLSRAVGILAHAWEQQQQGGRNKGPMPPSYLPLYSAEKVKS